LWEISTITNQLKIKFTNPDKTEFFNILRKRVDTYFTENKISPQADNTMVMKTICMLSLYFLPYLLMFILPVTLLQMFLLALIMGTGIAGIGLSVMHDANHGSYSKNGKTNRYIGDILNLIGGNSFTWKLQHNVNHHTYTNIHDSDEDIEGTAFLRFSPHSKLKKIHRYQHIYTFFFYGLMTFAWVFWKDYVKFHRHIKDGTNTNKKAQNRKELYNMLAFKVFYFSYIMVVPMYFLELSFGQWFLGFFCMHFIAGLILSLIFQLAHVVEGTTYPEPDESGNIENEWAIHQLHNTANFAVNNKFLNWYAGGLNFQIEHHLFPRICHVHYKPISLIVKATAQEYNIPYLENTTFSSALGSHIRFMKKLGRS
jgi:linoleoyl-CoA desaturase